MSREMIERQGRKCRKKSDIRKWLDKVITSCMDVVKKEHPNLSLKDPWAMRMIRKRIAGSISDGLERKLEKHGIKFPEEDGPDGEDQV